MNYLHVEARGGGINWRTLGVLCNSGVAASITLVVNVFCGVKIMKKLGASNQIAQKTRQLQLQLFRALLVQFFVPFILCFIPFSIIVALPLTGIRLGETGNIIANAVSIFPALDAFMVMCMVGR
ncbi:hypothetical protein PENTCL1PPCAC_15793, partial [Pristionchus entomophagus]